MDARLIEEIEGQIRIATEAKWTAERLDAEDRAKRLLFGFATALLAAAREGAELRKALEAARADAARWAEAHADACTALDAARDALRQVDRRDVDAEGDHVRRVWEAEQRAVAGKGEP